MRRSCTWLVCLIVSCLSFQAVVANDIVIPPWRGQPGTTFAEWTFSDSSPTPLPVLEDNPNGSSSTNVYPGVGQEWWDVWGGRQGVWPLSGTIEIEIPNYDVANPYKDIWIQLTWAPQALDTVPYVWEKLTGTDATVVGEIMLDPTGEPPPADDNWYHTTYEIHLEPNPSVEIVRIDGAIMVDQIVIDTICAPEPASLLVLAVGGLMLRKKR